jgi:hypothetical protein
MSLSAFDPDAFASASTNESNDTKFMNVPAGEYVAVIDKVEVRKTDGNEKNPDGSVVCDLTWAIDDAKLEAELGRRPTVRQGIFLDVTPDGKLDFGKGKNVTLGKTREALGMNEAGKSFNLLQLQGAGPAKIKVALTPSKTSEEMFANVKSVGRV